MRSMAHMLAGFRNKSNEVRKIKGLSIRLRWCKHFISLNLSGGGP